MATQWISPTWRMPENSNQSKVDNYSLDFGGVTNQRISIAASDDIIPTNAKMSISAWIYMDTSAVGVGRTIFSNGKDNSGAKEYMFEVDTNDNLLFTVRTLVSSPFYVTITGGTTISLNTWHHVAITWDGANLNLYLNGASDASPVAATSFYTNGTNDAPFIGVRRGGAGSYYSPWAGKLGQICYYNTGLSASQITALYNSGTPVNPMALTPLPTAYYPLGDSSTGSVSTLTTPNESVPSATVFDFRGSPIDYITMGNTLTKDGSTAFSISCWIKYTGAGTQMIVSKQDASGYGYLLHTGNHAGVKLTWYPCISAGGNVAVRTSSAYNDGNWHNVLATYDGSGNASGAKIYVDGTLDTNIITDTFTGTSSSTGPFQISARNGTSFPFVGDVSNVVVWSSDQNANKDNIYNNGVPQSTYTTTPEAWYKLNVDTSTWDGTDWIIGDSTANYTTALNFDGTNDYIETSGPNITSGGFSFSGWFKTSDTVNNQVIWNGVDSTTAKSFLRITGTALRLKIIDGSGGSNNIDNTVTTADGNWHHIAFTTDGLTTTDGVIVYVDGTALAVKGTLSNAGFASTTKNQIGSYAPNTWNFNGSLSNVSIFNTELTLGNITTLYNSGTPETAISFSPVSWWKLDNTTTGIQDSGSASNNGTNNGTTEVNTFVSILNGTSVNMVTANLVTSDLTRSIPYSSYSMELDGTADYITVPQNVLTNFTVSFWINPSTAVGASYDGILGAGTTSAQGGILRYVAYDGTASVGDVMLYLGGAWTGVAALTNGEWSHVALTYDSTADEFKSYKNGTLDTTISSPDFSGQSTGAHSFVEIGRRNGTAGTCFAGKISNVSLFNSALSQDQILTIYNGGVPNDISSLSPVNWWSLAGDSYYDGTNWICPDLGSGGNNGTSDGMGGTELIGDGPGSTVNGTASGYMNFIDDLKGDAPNSTSNAFSVNMTAIDRVTSIPG